MNNLGLNNDWYHRNNFNFLNQFSSGIEYCSFEQQIDIFNGLSTKQEDDIIEKKSKLFSQNVSHETTWAFSLLILASLSIASEIHNWNKSFKLSQLLVLKKTQIAEKQLPMYTMNSDSLLMAMPALPSQFSLAGIVSWRSTISSINRQKELDVNDSNALDTQSSDLGGRLMAIPETVYRPHIPRIKFFGHLD